MRLVFNVLRAPCQSMNSTVLEGDLEIQKRLAYASPLDS
jgi:hypothetical protein